MIRLLALLMLFSPLAFAEGSLEQSDYVGSWANVHLITEGESNEFRISENYSVSFTRSFSEPYPEQRFTTDANGVRFVEDLAIIEFHWEDGKLAYKFVLSGWKISNHRKIFGTMFMYNDGHIFNGLPVSFQSQD